MNDRKVRSTNDMRGEGLTCSVLEKMRQDARPSQEDGDVAIANIEVNCSRHTYTRFLATP